MPNCERCLRKKTDARMDDHGQQTCSRCIWEMKEAAERYHERTGLGDGTFYPKWIKEKTND